MNALLGRGTACANENDASLMQQIIEKDTAAFETLYDYYAQAVFKVLIRTVKDPGVAEDLLQETFWQVWRKAEQYTATGSVAAWLFRIARNKAIDYLRQQKAHDWREAFDVERLQEVDDPQLKITFQRNSTEEEVETHLNTDMLRHALLAIPADQRLCVELAYWEELSHSEIAAHVNQPLGTIKTRIQSGVEKLRRSLHVHAAYRHA